MPRDVDVECRLADIAAATVRVAEKYGTHAVTMRSVAKELGGSTTLVTNYLPSRARLIMNALDHAQARWDAEVLALQQHPPAQRLQELIRWQVEQSNDDAVLRTLIIEAAANAAVEPETQAAFRKESLKLRQLVSAAAADAGFLDPDWVADLTTLMTDGAYLALVECSDHWQEERVYDTIIRTLETLPRRAPIDAAVPATAP